jgi:pimeloyl-ACP methyl ester carboxylesterase
MSYFTYQEKKIYYEKTGNGSPIILLHGNTASSKMFMPIIPLLTDNFTVITMDFLGCGKSDRLEDWPADLWYEWGQQVAALCSHLNLRKISVIGCSGGALAAINFALEYPELIVVKYRDLTI